MNQIIITLNGKLRALAGRHGYTYVDLHSAFPQDKVGLQQEYTIDGVHLTELAYDLWEEILLGKLE